MRIITHDEREELTEHLVSRPDIWLLHNNVWLRRIDVECYGLAFKLQNGIADGLCALVHKTVEWPVVTSDDYISWLLEKYTAYATRLRVIHVLHRYQVPEHKIHVLSRDLCEVRGEAFVRKFERTPKR